MPAIVAALEGRAKLSRRTNGSDFDLVKREFGISGAGVRAAPLRSDYG
jgi:hypothetical protein